MNKRGMLIGLDLFSTFSEAERELLEDVFVVERKRRGTVLMRQGEAPRGARSGLFLVLDGEVDVRREPSRGGETIVHKVGRGELFGVVALVSDHPRTATCTALTDVTLAHLDRTACAYLNTRHTKLAARFEHMLARQLVKDLRSLTRALVEGFASGDSHSLSGAVRAT